MYYFCNVLDNVMDKNILKNIVECDTDDKVVEMQEYTLQNTTVYKVTVYYDIKKVLWKYKYKTYIFPFYFETKALAKKFLEYWDEFEILNGIYWNSRDRDCYMIKYNSNNANEYWMVDSFKWKSREYYDGYCHLQKGGVWSGKINTDAHYRVYSAHNFLFTDIFNIDNIARETSNTYVFKMIK